MTHFVLVSDANELGGIGVWNVDVSHALAELGHQSTLVRMLDRSNGPGNAAAHLPSGSKAAELTVEYYSDQRSDLAIRTFLGRLQLKPTDWVLTSWWYLSDHLSLALRRGGIARHAEVVHSDRHSFVWRAARSAGTVEAFIAVSRRVEARIHSMAETSNTATIVVPAGTPDVFINRQPRPLRRSTSAIKLAYVGRLTQLAKRVRDLPEIIKQIPSHCLVELHLFGEGEEYPYLQNAFASITHKTVFHGKMPREQLAYQLRELDCIILCSEYEGFPLALVEGMAAGLIPLATRVSGAEDLIVDGKNGFLIEIGDTKGFAAAIESLSVNEELFNTLANASTPEIRESLGWNQRVKQLANSLIELPATNYPDALPALPKGRSLLDHPWCPASLTFMIRRLRRWIREKR